VTIISFQPVVVLDKTEKPYTETMVLSITVGENGQNGIMVII
jgi:hypothetical protein